MASGESGFLLEELDDDEHEDDTCHHGVGFDEYCEDCEEEDEDERNGER